jgi:diguanylate cyclase (GGDEF)-like protein
MPGSVLAARLNDEGRLLLWTSAIVLALVLLLSIATTLSIVRPVRRFIAAMGQLASGDSNARMPRGGIKEIDTLAVAFNQMAEKVGAYQRQLETKLNEGTLQFLHLQDHDPLTQLPNRRQLVRYLRKALEVARTDAAGVAVLFIDLDNFKTINDSMGHVFGDRVLVAIASRIAEAVGPTAFVARPGGDEFTVICDPARFGSDPNEIGVRLLQAFALPLHVEGHDLRIGISVGASVFPEHADNAESLLSAADVALFHAKATGRRRLTIFSPTLLENVSVRFQIEQGLRQAIDRGELELFFQPEVSLQTRSTSVLEALLRWRMPDGKYASPGHFLPVAEESGLILEIGDWVLRRAVEITADWYRGGLVDVRVAINVSARQLLAQGFVARILSLLETHQLPASCIELELTENVLQTDAGTIEVLRTLRERGIAVALDDFGTGYSSLASLEQLPLTRVKLDRSLISGIHTSPRSLAIAQTITSLCHRLGLEVTAEGVEELQHLTTLLSEERLHVQGFLIARPVPAGEVLPLLQTMRSHLNGLLHQARSSNPDAVTKKIVRIRSRKEAR